MAKPLDGKIAWILGGGSGIGEASARVLAEDGAVVVLSGRGAEKLAAVAKAISAAGGRAETEPLDVADAMGVKAAAERIVARHRRLDILLNSAGLNVKNRHWGEMDAAAWDKVIGADLDGAFYAAAAVLPTMRAQKGGLVINVSSWAGHFHTYLTGPAYNAAKHGLVAMSAHLNISEGRNGIRATVISPGEVNTPILAQRPVPVPEAERARMLQADDLGATVRFVARLPAHVCVNEILISPTWNRFNLSQLPG
jgi:NADP-dependent 3-hydroxy acid dehydrogenase YdfG